MTHLNETFKPFKRIISLTFNFYKPIYTAICQFWGWNIFEFHIWIKQQGKHFFENSLFGDFFFTSFFHVRVTYLQCFTDAYGLWFIFLTKWYIIMHQLSAIVFLVLITIEGRKKPIWHEPRDKTVCNLIEKQTKQPNSWLVFQ